MRTITLRNNVIAILALTAFFSVCAPNSASAAKDVFVRTKPHVNVGTIGGEPAEIWSIPTRASLRTATRPASLRRASLEEKTSNTAQQGEAIIEQETVVELMLTLERDGEDGVPTGETDQVIVRHSSTRGLSRL